MVCTIHLVAGTKRPQFAVGQPIARFGPADAVLFVLLPRVPMGHRGCISTAWL